MLGPSPRTRWVSFGEQAATVSKVLEPGFNTQTQYILPYTDADDFGRKP